TGRVSVLAVVAAPGCALRDNDSANRINQLPDYEFAQLDAHNFAAASVDSRFLGGCFGRDVLVFCGAIRHGVPRYAFWWIVPECSKIRTNKAEYAGKSREDRLCQVSNRLAGQGV
ncbi:MAG: hypothetical protein AB1593_08430, partial [Pseudomonadota bacterium]